MFRKSLGLLLLLIPLTASASVPRDTVPLLSAARLAAPGWVRHDLWSGVTRLGVSPGVGPIAHSPYVPAARIPDMSSLRIVGTDDLRAVTATTNYPYSAFVRLLATFPNGVQGTCTGTMVSPSTVLTAAHCVYSHQHGWPARVQAAPGQWSNTAPFGVIEASAVAAHRAFVTMGDQSFDIGVVQLDGSDVGYDTGWLGVAAESDQALRNGEITVVGYPGDRDQGMVMYQQSGTVLDVAAEIVAYEMDSYRGMSGGPVFRQTAGGAVLVAVHAWESALYAYNGGTRITTEKLSLINEWIGEGPHCTHGSCERSECHDGACGEGNPQATSSAPSGHSSVGQSPADSPSAYAPQNYELACTGGGATWPWLVLSVLAIAFRRPARHQSAKPR